MDDHKGYAAVILAGGLSSRMKSFKPLLKLGGKTAIAWLAESIREAGIDNVVVVTGHKREELLKEVGSLGLQEAYNAIYEQGMFSSICAGTKKASELWPDMKGLLLMPVDCPLISPETIKKVTQRGDAASEKDFVVPVFEGKKGHPLLIPALRIKDILEYRGDGGLKGVTDSFPDDMIRLPVEDEGCILDMDTEKAYRELEEFLKNGRKRPSLEELRRGREIILVRHGETKQHDEPVFIGQYDVELSEKGASQAKDAGKRIAAHLLGEEKACGYSIYSSDLQRAKESARIVAEVLGAEGENGITCLDGLREIALGKWDGLPIREVKEKYPEEYERRGKDLFTFKTGNRSENFYDMQYRVVRTLHEILGNDPEDTLIIVAHSGVIRALENNLRGLRVDDEWEPLPKGGVRILL